MGCGCRGGGGSRSTGRPRTGGVVRSTQSRGTVSAQSRPSRQVINAKAEINRRRKEAIRNALNKG